MKHPLNPTALILIFFVLAQVAGLGLLAADLSTTTDEQGNLQVDYSESVAGPRPETTGAGSLTLLLIGVAIGTGLLLILAKFKLQRFWKVWYFGAVWVAMAVALGAITPAAAAWTLGAALAAWKLLRPNVLVHNLTEILIYTGIAFLIVPIFDVFWASILLIAIAIYDAIAVWKSKHMISLANFQTESKVFAGLHIPYTESGRVATSAPGAADKKTTSKDAGHTAILGGGDIAFPLLFSGTVLQWLVTQGYGKLDAFLLTGTITLTAAISLAALFALAKKDHFYPAMPFLSTGCFVGLGIIALLV